LNVSEIENAEIPEFAKKLVSQLESKFGFDWLTNAVDDNNLKLRNSTSIDVLEGIDANSFQIVIPDELFQALQDPEKGIDIFISNIEFFDWEDEDQDEASFTQDILKMWRDLRLDYYQTVMNQKLPLARESTYKDIESLSAGGRELICTTCGVFFYDNMSRHIGLEELYCSIDCQTKAVLYCIQCNVKYEVGKCVRKLRILKLDGFCSENCFDIFKDEEHADNRYIYTMKAKANSFGVDFDSTITRREVFKRAHGLCYLCNCKTNFLKTDVFDPYLATVDHVIPWTKGGSHKWDNVKNCCLRCNMVKKDRIY
jgi:5-methylcytosine-specific restriction endonuclease McrA